MNVSLIETNKFESLRNEISEVIKVNGLSPFQPISFGFRYQRGTVKE